LSFILNSIYFEILWCYPFILKNYVCVLTHCFYYCY
jgi:hypothetical protein